MRPGESTPPAPPQRRLVAAAVTAHCALPVPRDTGSRGGSCFLPSFCGPARAETPVWSTELLELIPHLLHVCSEKGSSCCHARADGDFTSACPLGHFCGICGLCLKELWELPQPAHGLILSSLKSDIWVCFCFCALWAAHPGKAPVDAGSAACPSLPHAFVC